MRHSPRRVDQIMAGFAAGDATSNAACLIRGALRDSGYESDIFADPRHIMPSSRTECRPVSEYDGREQDLLIHHFGIWSEATDFVLTRPARLLLLYHNITPGKYFRGYNDTMAYALDQSRERLPELLRRCVACWAVSEYNAAELRAIGHSHIHVLPLPYSPSTAKPNAAVLQRLAAPLKTILSVGRIAPNKKLEDLIRAFAIYHKHYNPFSRLFLVGSDRSTPRYVTYLKRLAYECKIPNVCFEGFVWPDTLAAYFSLADVYVSTSIHEGYCLPLVEAMDYKIPVIARKTGGTPEALGGAGITYEDASAEQLAELIHTALTDSIVHTELLSSQQQRIEQERSRNLAAELSELLK